MSRNAKVFVSVLLLLGVCVLFASFAEWQPANNPKFAAVFALAVCASVLRVALPKMAGDISFSLMFVMIGIVDLPTAETVLIGCTTLLIESVWKPGSRLAPLQVFFALANMSVAIACSSYVFHSAFLMQQRVELPFRILIAATTCFAVNTFSVSAATALSERNSLLKIWQERAIPRYPHYVLAATVAWAYCVVAYQIGGTGLGWPAGLLILPTLYLLQRTYSLYVGRLEDGKQHAEELASLHLRTIEALAGAIEAKDDTTSDHLKRVQVYAVEIGRELGLDERELEALRAAAVLHDIGKLAVPEHIISKPGRLTPEEFEKMKVHPVVGAEILERVRFPYPVAPIVRAHHEKWDGTGYPLGIRGEEIPIGARILSAVDVLDALASDRQYRRALPISEAMAKIAEESGRAFDPRIIAILRKRHLELEHKAHMQAHAVRTTAKLSTDIRVEKGAAPAAGFADTNNLDTPARRAMERSFWEALTRARTEVALAFDSAQPDGKSLGLTESLSVFAIRLGRMVSYEAIAVYVLQGGELVPEYVHGDNYRLFSSLRIPIGQGLSGWVAENRKAIINGNPSVEPGYLNDPKMFSTLGSALAVPLEADDTVIGVLTLYRDGRDAFTKDELSIVQGMAPRLAQAVEEGLSHTTSGIADDVEVDIATGLPGPRMLAKQFEAELGRAQRLNAPLAVLVCRIEGLRDLKDSYGYAESNKALRIVGSALRDHCHGYDIIARSGPAEFIVLAPGISKISADARIARISHISAGHGPVTTTMVVGAAFFPEDGTTPNDLLAAADRRIGSAGQIDAEYAEVRSARV